MFLPSRHEIFNESFSDKVREIFIRPAMFREILRRYLCVGHGASQRVQGKVHVVHSLSLAGVDAQPQVLARPRTQSGRRRRRADWTPRVRVG